MVPITLHMFTCHNRHPYFKARLKECRKVSDLPEVIGNPGWVRNRSQLLGQASSCSNHLNSIQSHTPHYYRDTCPRALSNPPFKKDCGRTQTTLFTSQLDSASLQSLLTRPGLAIWLFSDEIIYLVSWGTVFLFQYKISLQMLKILQNHRCRISPHFMSCCCVFSECSLCMRHCKTRQGPGFKFTIYCEIQISRQATWCIKSHHREKHQVWKKFMEPWPGGSVGWNWLECPPKWLQIQFQVGAQT